MIRVPDPADKAPALIEVETLAKPGLYTEAQLRQACLVAGCCKAAFDSVRFVYTLPPDA